MVLQKLDANHFCPPFVAGIPHWIWTFVRSISTCFAASRAESNPKREENGWILLDSVQGTSKPSWHPGNSKNRWSTMWTGNSSFCWTRLVTNSNCKVLLRLMVVDQQNTTPAPIRNSFHAGQTKPSGLLPSVSSPPLPFPSPTFCPHPNFHMAKKRKMLQTFWKPYRNACYSGYTVGWYHTSSQPLGINLIQ